MCPVLLKGVQKKNHRYLQLIPSPSPALLHNKHKRPFIIYFFLNDKKKSEHPVTRDLSKWYKTGADDWSAFDHRTTGVFQDIK